MRLARKLTLPMALSIFLVLVLGGIFSVRRELALFGDDALRDHHLVGTVLAAAAERELAKGDPQFEASYALVRDADLREPNVHASFSPIGKVEEPDRSVLLAGHEVKQLDWTRFLIVTTMPVQADGKTVAAVRLAEPLDEEEAFVRSTVLAVGTASVVLAIAGGIIALVLGRLIVGNPMRLLAERAREIGAGRPVAPLQMKQRDEIGELAEEFNRMYSQLAKTQVQRDEEAAKRLAAVEQLRHADRLATVGKLASGIAHELGTPLNVIHARARLIATGDASGEEAVQNAKVLVEESERITRIIRQLLDFARRRHPVKRKEDLGQMPGEVVRLLGTLGKKAEVSLNAADGADPLYAEIDHQQVLQVLTNLVVNAIQATPKNGAVSLSCSKVTLAPPPDVGGQPGNYVRVDVSDTGPGIAGDVLPHIFEPFFTTKTVGEGTGLGLSVAWGLARDHGGWIGVESTIDKGSRFSLYLPASEA
ncbi:MAG: ATP-binding protein [Myxococcaceae bacterium]